LIPRSTAASAGVSHSAGDDHPGPSVPRGTVGELVADKGAVQRRSAIDDNHRTTARLGHELPKQRDVLLAAEGTDQPFEPGAATVLP
jgi:hypothetical protein